MDDLFTPAEARLCADLQALAASIKPETEFTTRLEANLLATRGHSNAARVGLRLAAALLLILFGLTLATLTIPPLRIIAQGIIDSLFQRAGSDKLDISSASPPNLPVRVASFEEGSLLTAFTARKPMYIPAGYMPNGINANQATLQIWYKAPGSILRITQQIAAEPHFDLPIGASAKITKVILKTSYGTLNGEYTEGIWITTSSNTHDSKGNPLILPYKWRSDSLARQLRWQDGNILYEVFAGGGSPDHPNYIPLEEMIRIAEGMH